MLETCKHCGVKEDMFRHCEKTGHKFYFRGIVGKTYLSHWEIIAPDRAGRLET